MNTTPILTALAIGTGATLGAWLRWGLTLWLGNAHAPCHIATLAANWLGGLGAGAAMALLAASEGLSPLWRMFWITGLLGGLTTFSAFSIELAEMVQQQRWALLGSTIALHVGGSVACTLLGMACMQAVQHN